MKKILSLAIVLACLFSLGAAQSPSPCSVPSFKGARSLNIDAPANHPEAPSVAVADLNNDGRPDAVVVNATSSAVAVMLGTGQGFSDPVSFPVGGSRPFSVAVGDFNRDGKADVVTANPASSNLSVILGDGAGGFLSPLILNPSADPIAVAVGDFNGDGKQDLAAACSNAGVVKVTLGDGAGGFGPFGTYTVGSRPRAVVVADFNLDGKADIATPNTFSNNVSVLLGDGAGDFAAQMEFAALGNPQDLAAADFNGDGKTDLAVAGFTPGVSVLFGAGDGRFAAPQNFSLGASAVSVIAGDFNNDGSPDIAAGADSSNVSILLGNGAGGFGAAKNFGVGFSALYLATADYNFDGDEDLLVAVSQAGALVPLAGDGAGNFAATPRPTTTSNGASIALEDFNGDGRLDVVYGNNDADTVSVRMGDGAGSFGAPSSFAAGLRPLGVNIADFNNDGKADVIAAGTSLTSLAVLLGDGLGSFAPPIMTTVSQFKPSFIAVGDLNQDNKADVVVVRVDNNFAVTVLLGNGAGGFVTQADHSTAPLPRAIVVGDFTGDGNQDLAVTDSSVSILPGDGAGGFGARITTDFGENTGPSAIASGDFNGDGKLDLAVSNEFTHNVSVLIGQGAGHFAPRVNYKVGVNPVTLAAADFNGDGRLDLVAGNRSSINVSVLLGDGAGVFGQPYNWSTPASPTSLDVGDIDGDGRVDIVAAGVNFLSPLRNTCGQEAVQPSARLSVGDVTIAEPDSGAANAVFTVSLAAASAEPVSVKYVTRAASAERGRDFQPAAGVLNFAPGVTSQTVTVQVDGDTTDEFDEVFTLNLFDPSNALIADRQGSVVITDNDAPPSLSAGNISIFEGQGAGFAALPVTLSQPSGKLVTVNYATTDGTATAGADYVGGSGTLSIPTGVSVGVINVQVVGDSVDEPDETFAVNLSGPSNASVAAAQGVVTLVNDDASSLQFGGAQFSAAEGSPVDVLVTRTGDTSREAFVNYATTDVTANSRQDYTTAVGRLRFAPGETQKIFRVLTNDDRFDDDNESFTVTLSAPVGAVLGAQTSTAVNITDNDASDGPSPVFGASFDPDFFVRQHYADFLNREPDAAGLAFWVGQTTNCGNPNLEVCRINVSAAFFQSIEFQETGYLAYRVYKTAYGDTTSQNVAGTVPVIRLNEFLSDTQGLGQGVVVGQGEWQTQLEANKNAYALEFVVRQRFVDAYPASMTAAQFLDNLALNAGVTLSQSERDQLLAILGATPAEPSKRAQVLRAVAENEQIRRNEFRRAFVLMQYYGYLRRNPDDAPDTDFRGWKFWLDKLNQFNGNFVAAEMVKAFISSDEYRHRFGQ
jgi:hypothetical protein